MNNYTKITIAGIAFYGFCLLAVLAFWGTVAWVIVHFATKYW